MLFGHRMWWRRLSVRSVHHSRRTMLLRLRMPGRRLSVRPVHYSGWPMLFGLGVRRWRVPVRPVHHGRWTMLLRLRMWRWRLSIRPVHHGRRTLLLRLRMSGWYLSIRSMYDRVLTPGRSHRGSTATQSAHCVSGGPSGPRDARLPRRDADSDVDSALEHGWPWCAVSPGRSAGQKALPPHIHSPTPGHMCTSPDRTQRSNHNRRRPYTRPDKHHPARPRSSDLRPAVAHPARRPSPHRPAHQTTRPCQCLTSPCRSGSYPRLHRRRRTHRPIAMFHIQRRRWRHRG